MNHPDAWILSKVKDKFVTRSSRGRIRDILGQKNAYFASFAEFVCSKLRAGGGIRDMFGLHVTSFSQCNCKKLNLGGINVLSLLF